MQTLIKTPSHLSTKKKKKQKTKNANPKTQTVFPDPNLDSNLQFFITPPYTHRSGLCVPTHQTDEKKKKKNLYNSKNLCSFSVIVKTENLCLSSATTDDLEAIPPLLFNNEQFKR